MKIKQIKIISIIKIILASNFGQPFYSLFTKRGSFNKFLLTIDINYVSWENKEQINELYYQITHELIRSFELLYKYK
jgi:hypothetical protein